MSEHDSFDLEEPITLSPEARTRITGAAQESSQPEEVYGPQEEPIIGVESRPVYAGFKGEFGGGTHSIPRGLKLFDSRRVATVYPAESPKAYNLYERQYLEDLAHRLFLSRLPLVRTNLLSPDDEYERLDAGRKRYVDGLTKQEER